MSEFKGNLIRLARVREITALSRSSIYAYMAAGTFPAAIKISARSIGFLESEVRDWCAARIAAHRKPQPSAEAVRHAE